MNRHKIGTYAGGVAGMQDLCAVLRSGREPISTPVEYETIGDDLNGVPIEAGFGQTLWSLGDMTQEDYDFLLEFQGNLPGASMYVHTSRKAGESGIEFGDYLAVVKRPTFDSRVGLVCYGVKMEIVAMEPA